MSDDWGPWINHDGCGAPEAALARDIEVEIDTRRGMIWPRTGDVIDRRHPGWTWRWRGGCRVCVDPVYAAIAAYRVRRSPSFEQLAAIARDAKAPAPIRSCEDA